MSQRLEEFLRELPGKGVPDNAVQLYRAVLEEFETFLGRAAALRFSKYEVNRFVTQRQRAGASERELRNLNTACAAYLSYCEAQAPGPAVGTAGEPAADPVAAVTPPPPREQRRVLLIVLGCLALVVCLIGGCLADKARQARVERAYSDELRRLGEASRGDRELLRDQVLAAATQRGIRLDPKNVVLGVSPLGPDNMVKLPMDQRMRAVAAMQGQMQMRVPPAPGGGDGSLPRSRVREEPLYYVEINVLGEVKGVFGAHKLDIELHLLGGATPQAPPRP